MSETITVVIEGGKATVTTEGFTGRACEDVTAALEKALGTVESNDRTPEFYQEAAQNLGQQ